MQELERIKREREEEAARTAAAEAQLASVASPVIVVTGHEREEVAAALAGLDVTLVHNPDFASGLASSVRVGLAALPEAAAGVVVSLGDMPNVTPQVIDRLAQVFAEQGEAKAVVPTLLGQRGNPVLLARALFAEVAQLTGDQGARLVLLAGKPLGEPIAQYGPFVMNTQEEIEQALRDYRAGTLAEPAA